MPDNKPNKTIINLQLDNSRSYIPGADIKGEFKEIGKWDAGLVHGMSQEDVRARNQPDWKAVGNGFVQMVTGTIGDLVASPGYAYEGLKAGTVGNADFENWFISAGDYIKGLGEEYAPVYVDETSQGVFRPFDGEWWGSSIAQFGPTIAMMAATFLTDGLLYPALASRLSKFGQAGKWINAAEGWLKTDQALARNIRAMRMAGTSRLIEGGMEASETYKSTFADKIRNGANEEEAKKAAGDAAARVWTNNMMLAAVDALQFKGILDGLGTIGNFGKVKKSKALGLGYEMGSEALEEGYQFAVSKEAENEIKYRENKKNADTTILDEFIGNLGDPEMQKAMVQGALGGAVFTGTGLLANKISTKLRERYNRAQNFHMNNKKYELEKEKFDNAMDYIKRFDSEGKLELEKTKLLAMQQDPNIPEEEQKVISKTLTLIDTYESTRDAVKETDPDVKDAKVTAEMRKQFAAEELEKVEKELAETVGDNPVAQEIAAKEKIKAAKKLENPEVRDKLTKKYEEELATIQEQKKESSVESKSDLAELKDTAKANADVIADKADNIIKVASELTNAIEERKELNSEAGKNLLKEQKIEEAKNEKLKDVMKDAQKIRTPAMYQQQIEAHANDPDAISTINGVMDTLVELERKGQKPPDSSNTQEVLDYYRDKPLSIKKKFGLNSFAELENKLKSPSEPVAEKSPAKEVADIFETKAKEEEAPVKTLEDVKEAIKKGELARVPEKPISKVIADDADNVAKAKEESIPIVPEEEYKETEEEYTEEPLSNEEKPDTTDPSWAKVFDTGLIKFQRSKTDKTKIGVWIVNHKDYENQGLIELDVELIDEEREIYKIKTDHPKYTFPRKMRINEYYTLKDKSGNPVKSSYINLFTDYDIDLLRNLYRHANEEVFVEIDTNNSFNNDPSRDFRDIRMDLVIYPNGKRKVIGVLSAFNNNHGAYNKFFEKIRRDIYEELKNRTDSSRYFQYSKSTKIPYDKEKSRYKILGGRYNTTFNKSNRIDIASAIPDDTPVILGVAYTIPGTTTKDIHLNLDDNSVNQEIAEFVKDKAILKEGLTPGATYVFARDGSGRLVATRVFNKSVKQVPRLRDFLLKAISSLSATEAAKIVKFRYENKSGEKKLVPDFNEKLAELYSGVKIVYNEGKLEFYRKVTRENQEDSYITQKDSNGTLYNDTGLEEGAILVNEKDNKLYRVTDVSDSSFKVTEVDKNLNPIGTPIDSGFLTADIQDGNVGLHYSYNYYKFYDMGNKPLQIDHTQVNTGNYNQVVNERLETDLIAKQPFHSTKFEIELTSLEKKEEKKEENSLQSTNVEEQRLSLRSKKPTSEELFNFFNQFPSGMEFIGEDNDVVVLEKIVSSIGTEILTTTSYTIDPQTGERSVLAVAEYHKKQDGSYKGSKVLGTFTDDTIKYNYPSKKEQVDQTRKVTPSVKVEQFTITKKDGKYYYDNGNEVTDEVTINKAEVKFTYDPKRIVEFNNTRYYVLPDNKIISLGESTKGKERFKTGSTRDKILHSVYGEGKQAVSKPTETNKIAEPTVERNPSIEELGNPVPVTGNFKIGSKKKTFKVVTHTGGVNSNFTITEEEAYPVQLEGVYEEFFVMKKGNYWVVSEASTGYGLGASGSTREEAVKVAVGILQRLKYSEYLGAISKAKERLEDYIHKQDLSDITVNKSNETVEPEEDRLSARELLKRRRAKQAETKKEEPSVERVLEEVNKLSTEEKDLLKEVHKENIDSLEEDNSNLGKFVVNQVVRHSSGRPVIEKIKNIIKKIAKAILSVAIITNMYFASTSFVDPNSTLNKSDYYTQQVNGNLTYPDSIVGDTFYNNLSDNAKKAYSFQQSKVDNQGKLEAGYVIADKPNARVYIFNDKNEIVKDFPGIFGENYGDQQFKVNIDFYDLSPEDQKKFGNVYNYQQTLGIPRVTPSGVFSVAEVEEKAYGSENVYTLQGTLAGGAMMAFHPVVSRNNSRLDTESIEDNRASWGCFSVSLDNWNNYVKDNLSGKSLIFVLPESSGVEFDPAKMGHAKEPYLWDITNKLKDMGVTPPKFRGVNKARVRKLWNKREELKWLESNIPQVPTHVYSTLSWISRWGANGYGMLYNSAIHLLENAQVGTSYHEAFHAVFNLMLEPSERVSLLKQANKKYEVKEEEIEDMIKMLEDAGFTITREEAILEVLEDKMADDFMEYVILRKVNAPTSMFGKFGRKIVDLFQRLYDTLRTLITNKKTMDQYFREINRGYYKSYELKRPVSSVTPKFRKHPLYPNPGEYQNALDTMTSLLDDAIMTHRLLNPKKKLKALVRDNILFPNQFELSPDSLQDNLIFSETLEYSVFNKVMDKIAEIEANNPEDPMLEEFDKFLAAMMTVSTDGQRLRPKLMAFDILKNLSSRGIVINIDTSKIEEQELGQPEIGESIGDLEETTDFRESWQFLSLTISPMEKLGEQLKLRLNQIPIEGAPGYLGFPAYHGVGHVYNQLQQALGNSYSFQNMMDKLRIAATKDPMFQYILDNFSHDEKFLGNLFIAIGQKNHPKFVTVLQDGAKDNVTSKVIPTNVNTQLNKVYENIIGTFISSSPLLNADKSIDIEKAKEVNKKLKNLLQSFKDFNKSKKPEEVFPEGLLSLLADTLNSAGIDIPVEKLIKINSFNSKKFNKAILNTASSFYSFFESLADGVNPIEKSDTGLRNFVKALKGAYSYDVQASHKNPSGGQVYEWIDGNYLGRLSNILKDKNAALDYINGMQRDEYYKHSPLLNLIKNSYTGNRDNSMYSVDPEKIQYILFADQKLQGDTNATEYADMSDRQLYINLLISYFNSNHFDGTAYLPAPVHSDSSTMTGLQFPVIQNLEYSVDGKKGILDYLYEAAYQEYIRVKLERDTTENQKIDSNKGKFLFFDNIEESKDKEVLLAQDSSTEEGQAKIREILEKAVRVKHMVAVATEINKMKELDLISYNEPTKTNPNGSYTWKHNLMNGTPVEAFINHFVGNFMFFQNQFGSVFNGDLSYYKNVGDFYKRSKQTWSPGTYLDTSQTRPTYNVSVLSTNYISKEDSDSSYNRILEAAKKLWPDNLKFAEAIADLYDAIDETDGQSYIDLYRYREQQKGLHRWDDNKEDAYRRLISGEYNMRDMEEVFNVNKPFYYGMHFNSDSAEVIPTQNKNSEFVIIPAFANPNNPFFNSKYREMLERMGYSFDDNHVATLDEAGRDQGKHIDQFVFDSAIKVGLFGAGTIQDSVPQKFNNSDWRLQMETPEHYLNEDVIFATQVRKHMINDLDLNHTYTVRQPITVERDGKKITTNQITGEEWLKAYNKVIIKDIEESYKEVAKKFDSFETLINALREEVIKRDLGDQYLQALDYIEIKDSDGQVIDIKTRLPLWHPLHLYRIESMLNSFFTKGVTRQKLGNGVSLANLSSFGFAKKPKIVTKPDGSIDHIEAYVPAYNSKILDLADENGIIDVKKVEKELGKEALRGMVWRIPNEDKYSTFNIKIIGFLPRESGGAIVLPPEITKIAGLD